MGSNELSAVVKVAACICGKDGLISSPEEEMMFSIISDKFPSFSLSDFNTALDDFFDSEDHIEDFLKQVITEDLRHFAIQLSEKSASVDGLDILENIALQKAYAYWGIK